MVTPRIPSPLKFHGGKSYLAKEIVALMPPHLHYVEPYFGGGSVLLAKEPEGVSEVVNDLDGELSNFWTVLQDVEMFEQFHRSMQVTPFSEVEWKAYGEARLRSMLLRACRFFVRCRMSLAGRMKDFTTLTRKRVRRGMNAEASAWLSCVDGLPEVHARLKRVVIFNREALDVIRQQDGEDTLTYCDPPYLHETRVSTDTYTHEMSYQDHRDLLEVLKKVKGKFLLSGYDNDLYRGYANTTPKWKKHVFNLPNNAAGGDSKRRMVECVWTNF